MMKSPLRRADTALAAEPATQSRTQALLALAGQGAALGVLASLIGAALTGWSDPARAALGADRAGVALLILAGLLAWGSFQSGGADAAVSAGLGRGHAPVRTAMRPLLRLLAAAATCFLLEYALRLA
ncbi:MULTISPECIES: hypothetical protein [Deinococcus]|nr:MULTISPECIES: hypothetical protein [Deinococcus]